MCLRYILSALSHPPLANRNHHTTSKHLHTWCSERGQYCDWFHNGTYYTWHIKAVLCAHKSAIHMTSSLYTQRQTDSRWIWLDRDCRYISWKLHTKGFKLMWSLWGCGGSGFRGGAVESDGSDLRLNISIQEVLHSKPFATELGGWEEWGGVCTKMNGRSEGECILGWMGGGVYTEMNRRGGGVYTEMNGSVYWDMGGVRGVCTGICEGSVLGYGRGEGSVYWIWEGWGECIYRKDEGSVFIERMRGVYL